MNYKVILNSILVIEKCYCEFENMSADNNGIMCQTTDGSSYLFGSCDTGVVCSGNDTYDYANRKSKLCEGMNTYSHSHALPEI